MSKVYALVGEWMQFLVIFMTFLTSHFFIFPSFFSSLATLNSLDKLQSLQSESQAGAGEAKAFRLITVHQEFSCFIYFFIFSVKSLMITTLGWQEHNAVVMASVVHDVCTMH